MAVEISENLKSRLTFRPRELFDGVITNIKPATCSAIQRSPSSGDSLGALELLPLELLHHIFSQLDLKTLSNIKQTCLRGTTVVESLPEFRDLIQHAPKALSALGSTGLLKYHSAHTLHSVFRSTSCVSCSEYGAFLFLPTAERCCYECLRRNQSLWVASVSQAQSTFELSASDLRELSVMLSLPGRYWVGYSNSRKRRLRLVSVKAAKTIAIRRDGSTDLLRQKLEARRRAGLSLKEYHAARWLLEASLQAVGPEHAMRASKPNEPNDHFCGMAAVPFPSSALSGRIEEGTWCLGCKKLCSEYLGGDISHPMTPLASTGTDVRRLLSVLQFKARSEEDFWKHVRDCAGAKALRPNLERELLGQ